MPPPPFQFTLGRLMGLIAAVAVGLGLWVCFPGYPTVQLVIRFALLATMGAGAFAGAVGCVGVLLVWMLRSNEPRP